MKLNKTQLSAVQSSAATRGFTLVEVLVALVITAIGLLGIAKIQALSYSSTGTSSMRSLAAIQASSLASMMRANRAYWGSTASVPTSLTITNTTISDNTLNTTATAMTECLSGGANAPCVPATLAAFDLHWWANTLSTLLPSPTTTISCSTAATPVECSIAITWTEKNVAIDAKSQGLSMAPQTYTLYVEP